MNINIHDVTDIIIENVDSGGNGTTWRTIKIKGKGGVHQIVLFAAKDDPENLDFTLGKKQCLECLGEGQIVTENAVADWDHGGFIRESLTNCPECFGTGEVENDDA